MHLTIGMFGDLEFFSKFGKPGTANDLLIRNQSEGGNVLTFVAPNSDRIQSLLQAVAMSDYPLVVVNEITQQLGEILLALDESCLPKGLIITDYFEDKIRTMIKDMSISGFDFCKKDESSVREKILSFNPARNSEPAIVTIDNYFPVKGVGTVILGLVKSGTVKQYNKMKIYPAGIEVTIKSMQSQDKDVKETEPGQRIGLAVKGVEPDDLKRGYVVSDKEIKCSKSLSIKFKKSKYSKLELSPRRKLMVSIGLQVISGEIKDASSDIITVELENPIAIYQEKCILATADSMPRIVGSGKVI